MAEHPGIVPKDGPSGRRAFPRSRRSVGLLVAPVENWLSLPDILSRPPEDWLPKPQVDGSEQEN